MALKTLYKFIRAALLIAVFFVGLRIQSACADSAGADYLVDLGTMFYQAGRYEEAALEFRKALLIDPENERARGYLDSILPASAPAVVPAAPAAEADDTSTDPDSKAVNTDILFGREQAQISEYYGEPVTPVPVVNSSRAGAAERYAPVSRPVERYRTTFQPREKVISSTLDSLSPYDAQRAQSAITPVTAAPAMTEPAYAAQSAARFYGQGIEQAEPAERVVRTAGLPPLKMRGRAQMSLGLTSDDVIWKRGNFDLNEENWRQQSGDAFNHFHNTYDPRIYQRLSFNLYTDQKEGLNMFSEVTIDPWSFLGTSDTFTVTGAGGDTAELQLKYWSNTGYTLNENYLTLQNGDGFALQEIKVTDGKTDPAVVRSTFGNTFNIPETKIHRTFWPLRQLWLDYKEDAAKLRIFPSAYEKQALTSKDPLQVSNRHIYWEPSPWLHRWKPGELNEGATPDDFTRGEYDDSYAFISRDSDAKQLTTLRGATLEYSPDDSTSFVSTVASPKGLWQEYDQVDNVISATQLRHRFSDSVEAGGVYTYRAGYNEKVDELDSQNHVVAADVGYEVVEGVKAQAEIAASATEQDLTSPGYETRTKGNAYYLSLFGRYPQEPVMDLEYGYDSIRSRQEPFFSKYRFFFSRMDTGFKPSLANYHRTREDQFWSRHIHFRKPFERYFTGIDTPELKWEDVEPYGIGDGIDAGRDTIGARWEIALPEYQAENLFDVRYVNRVDGEHVETVTRDELTFEIDERTTAKLLGIYDHRPDTTAGLDPYIYDSTTGEPLVNTFITEGRDPSTKMGSFGLEYELSEWARVNGIWERTNDYSLAYGNFPRGILNSSSFETFTVDGDVFRRDLPFLYDQNLYPLPPYKYYNVFRTGLGLKPMDKMDVYIDYTHNDFKDAGQVSDGMNHIGFEVAYVPTRRFGLNFRYTYSKWKDLNDVLARNPDAYDSYHNIFAEARFLGRSSDEFVLQYGESGLTPLSVITFDPYGGSYPVLETQHIVRMYYRKRF